MFVVSLICLACVFAPGRSVSQNVLDASYFINGDTDNREQYKANNGYLLMEARLVPFTLKAKEEAVAIYMEEAVNGILEMLYIGILSDGPNCTVNMQMYNFAEYHDLKPFTYDYKSVQDVPWDALTTDEDCVATIEFYDTPEMVVYFPDCRFTMRDGKHPRINANYTCDAATAVFPSAIGDSPNEPYEFHLPYPKYPLVHAPDDYINPCDPRRRNQPKNDSKRQCHETY